MQRHLRIPEVVQGRVAGAPENGGGQEVRQHTQPEFQKRGGARRRRLGGVVQVPHTQGRPPQGRVRPGASGALPEQARRRPPGPAPRSPPEPAGPPSLPIRRTRGSRGRRPRPRGARRTANRTLLPAGRRGSGGRRRRVGIGRRRRPAFAGTRGRLGARDYLRVPAGDGRRPGTRHRGPSAGSGRIGRGGIPRRPGGRPVRSRHSERHREMADSPRRRPHGVPHCG